MGLELRINVNHASVMHFSKVLEVFGGLPLPGKNINSILPAIGRKKEHSSSWNCIK